MMSAVKTTRIGGVAEIAEKYGVDRNTVSTSWAARRGLTGFPQPVAVLRMGPVYDLDQVDRWYASWTSEPQPRKRGASRGR